jgi:endonuclease YncB( thermonuclease family)
MLRRVLITFLLLITPVFLCSAYEISGLVTKVIDGDTFHLLPDLSAPSNVRVHKDGTISVRLRGCDAPEKDQPYGQGAKEHLASLILKNKVKVQIMDVDRYGRVVGYVFLNGKNINLEQIKSGSAWAYTEFLDRPYASEFYEAEKEARKKRLGLWKQLNPLPPWEWRKIKRTHR